jgi:leucyl aminopeptidase
MIDIIFSAVAPAECRTFLCLMPKGGLETLNTGVLAQSAGDALKSLAAHQKFKGESGAMLEHYHVEAGAVTHMLLLGLGDGTPADCETAGGKLSAHLLTKETHAALGLDGLEEAQAIALLSAARLRSWRHDIYKTKMKEAQKPKFKQLHIIAARPELEAAWEQAQAVTSGVSFARMLKIEPANILYPESFVEHAKLLHAHGVSVKTLDEKDMAAMGFGALLGVAQGSVKPPRLLILQWDGSNGTAPASLALVGKGVTFDTGGISIKPAAGMDEMKYDMGGAAAVAGTMLALALRKSKAHVVGICALVENMPDGNAQRPGDIVTSLSGQTIEVLNTDAEGRLILADALTYVQREYAPKMIIDLATLTGAMVVALGHEMAGYFSNNDELAAMLTQAGADSRDKLWRMPLDPAYDKAIDSPIADMQNIGGRDAGSITAAQFLQRFIEKDTAWAHIDIAGTAWVGKAGATHDKGPTGYGVRLLNALVATHFE